MIDSLCGSSLLLHNISIYQINYLMVNLSNLEGTQRTEKNRAGSRQKKADGALRVPRERRKIELGHDEKRRTAEPRMAEQSSGATRLWWWWQLRNCSASCLLQCGGAGCGRRRKGFVTVLWIWIF
ncbi:uncharacterized protein DS421_4g118840 [Arachis hypogaea]|nr:uncharacterized protein DS421_4g118840 [Arachis hypogaea]